MTWKHGTKMSKIDRIQASFDFMGNHRITTDWTYTDSDHCAIIVTIPKVQIKKRDHIVRIDTRFMSNVVLKERFNRELSSRMMQLSETKMDPLQSLEFLKMNIRSIAIEIASNHKKEMDKELDEIKTDISFWQMSFECAKSKEIREIAQERLDNATDRRDKYLNDRGIYLSERSKCNWYQEGEKGSKYFLIYSRQNLTKKKWLNSKQTMA